MIAEYAFRHRDKAKAYSPGSNGLKKLRELHLTRKKLKDCEVCLKNLSGSLEGKSAPAMKALRTVKESLKDAVKALEKEIKALLMKEEGLSVNASLTVSVPYISWVTASAILLDTRNFSLFDTPRRYASHVGCVPCEHSSGTSINRRARASKASNRYVNSLLTQGANSLITHNRQTREYAEKKRKEGKPHGFIVNNVRNKIVHRLFAVIRERKPFERNYKSEYEKKQSCDRTGMFAT